MLCICSSQWHWPILPPGSSCTAPAQAAKLHAAPTLPRADPVPLQAASTQCPAAPTPLQHSCYIVPIQLPHCCCCPLPHHTQTPPTSHAAQQHYNNTAQLCCTPTQPCWMQHHGTYFGFLAGWGQAGFQVGESSRELDKCRTVVSCRVHPQEFCSLFLGGGGLAFMWLAEEGSRAGLVLCRVKWRVR